MAGLKICDLGLRKKRGVEREIEEEGIREEEKNLRGILEREQ